nr:ATP-dependent Clp protease proteolytic subunit 6, chloroplastic-like isoform X2 [Ipomoea batatas]
MAAEVQQTPREIHLKSGLGWDLDWRKARETVQVVGDRNDETIPIRKKKRRRRRRAPASPGPLLLLPRLSAGESHGTDAPPLRVPGHEGRNEILRRVSGIDAGFGSRNPGIGLSDQSRDHRIRDQPLRGGVAELHDCGRSEGDCGPEDGGMSQLALPLRGVLLPQPRGRHQSFRVFVGEREWGGKSEGRGHLPYGYLAVEPRSRRVSRAGNPAGKLTGLSSKVQGLRLKHDQNNPNADNNRRFVSLSLLEDHDSWSDVLYISVYVVVFLECYPTIEARRGNPPVMPAVLTPAGPLDLSMVLFRNRIVFVGQPVNGQVAQRVISQLVTLATIDENADILMYINCPGGSTYSVMAIYDCMSWIKPKVGTVCLGVAASQGTLLLAGGEKGMRYAMPNARIMVHQPQSGCGGHVEDVRRQVNEAVQSRHVSSFDLCSIPFEFDTVLLFSQKIDKMFAAFTGQPLEKVQDFTERDYFMSAAEAMDFGLIDGILETEY